MKAFDKFFLIVFLIIQVNFFDLVNTNDSFLSGITGYSQKKLLLVAIGLYVVLRLFSTDIKNTRQNNFSFYLLFLLASWGAVLIGTIVNFHQSIFSTFLAGYYFLIVILYYVYSKILTDWKDWQNFTKVTAIFSVIFSITKLVQSFIYVKFNILLLHLNSNLDQHTATSMRFVSHGFTRIPSVADFTFFGTLLILVCMITKKDVFSQKIEYGMVLVNVMCIFLVGQTRIYMVLSMVIIVLYLVKIAYEKFGLDFYYLMMVILIIPIVYLAYKGIIKLFFSSGSRSVSLSIRLEAIDYFWNHLTLNKWFSMGFARDDLYSGLLHGKYIDNNLQIIQFNFDDVGMIGFIGRFGVLGIINVSLYAVVLVRAFVKSKMKYATTLIMVIVIGSWVSISLYDPQRIFYLPILLAYLNFLAFAKDDQGSMNGEFSINE